MQVAQRPLEAFIERIRSRDAFALSRWGNGEWDSLFGRTEGRNRSGHRYFPKMGVELRNVLLGRPPYMLGMQNLALRLYEGRIEAWLAENELAELNWINADVFHKASAKGRIMPLVEALRDTPALIMVGPAHLRKLEDFLGYQTFVDVPLPDCYLTQKQTSLLKKSHEGCDRACKAPFSAPHTGQTWANRRVWAGLGGSDYRCAAFFNRLAPSRPHHATG
jgi:hypothetical protein